MTQFWQPVKLEVWEHCPGLMRKQLGHGHYVLWCRCDLCGLSGPSFGFTVLFKDHVEDPHHVCEQCGGHEDLWRELAADGWVAV